MPLVSNPEVFAVQSSTLVFLIVAILGTADQSVGNDEALGIVLLCVLGGAIVYHLAWAVYVLYRSKSDEYRLTGARALCLSLQVSGLLLFGFHMALRIEHQMQVLGAWIVLEWALVAVGAGFSLWIHKITRNRCVPAIPPTVSVSPPATGTVVPTVRRTVLDSTASVYPLRVTPATVPVAAPPSTPSAPATPTMPSVPATPPITPMPSPATTPVPVTEEEEVDWHKVHDEDMQV